jgi:hypothetical protein
MGAIELVVWLREVSAEHGDFRLVSSKRVPDEWLALWDGAPPPGGFSHPAIASVGIVGTLDGRPVYAERLPVGFRLSDAAPPRELGPYMAAAILEALSALSRAGQVHGLLSPRCVFLGIGGEVVLIGRGRGGAPRTLDLLSAATLLPSATEETWPGDDPEGAAVRMRQRTSPSDRERLAAWVRSQRSEFERSIEAIVVILARPVDESADEVVPDLGPDGGEGLLERWSATTSSGTTGEPTAEVGLVAEVARVEPPPLEALFDEDRPHALPSPSRSGVPTSELDEHTVTQASPRLGQATETRRTVRRAVELGCAMLIGGVLTLVLVELARRL